MSITRVRDTFRSGRPAFMPYVLLGYPDFDASLECVRRLCAAGADLLELGVPFSDPIADGPVIQAAAQRALQQGMSVARALQGVAELRRQGVQTPAVLMSYVNPLMAYGLARLAADAAAAGLDGLIVPDLPPEEAGELAAACRTHDLALIHLLAPNSTADRIAVAAAESTGFLYLVSLTGVTGARVALPPDLAAFIGRVRAATRLPLAVGFGIGNGEQARQVAGLADGVIVGSALVQAAGESPQALSALAQEIRQALDA